MVVAVKAGGVAVRAAGMAVWPMLLSGVTARRLSTTIVALVVVPFVIIPSVIMPLVIMIVGMVVIVATLDLRRRDVPAVQPDRRIAEPGDGPRDGVEIGRGRVRDGHGRRRHRDRDVRHAVRPARGGLDLERAAGAVHAVTRKRVVRVVSAMSRSP